MKSQPIIFSAPMIRALQDGRKSQTRRIVSAGNADFGSAPRAYWDHCDLAKAWTDGRADSGMYLHVPCAHDESCDHCRDYGWDGTVHRLYPRWEVGDVLWVREALILPEEDDPTYAADGAPLVVPEGTKWGHVCGTVPSIHMPRWASRITLQITGIRVERVNGISEEDAQAEGIYYRGAHNAFNGVDDYPYHTAPDSYRALWESINGPGSWQANPFVWVLELKRINEEAVNG